ncbi:MAG: hypothetical protein LBK43_03600 [Treponema sp.]|jgi:hypothetical protein|nr:hypothetical protein [Treponema sp.]
MAISINFLDQQNSIINYIEDHYKEYIPEQYPEPNEYTSEFLDPDKFKKSFTVFFDFGEYTFNWKTNESELQEIEFTVYLMVRNDSSAKLREKILQYTTAFYQMFDESGQSFDDITAYGRIASINFYQWPEGNYNMKVSEINLILRSEI